jgi:hypothetical protein
VTSISNSCHVGSCARAYLDFFRFWNWEGLDKIFDLFSLYHEVVHEFLLVGCSGAMGVQCVRTKGIMLGKTPRGIDLRRHLGDQLYPGYVASLWGSRPRLGQS